MSFPHKYNSIILIILLLALTWASLGYTKQNDQSIYIDLGGSNAIQEGSRKYPYTKWKQIPWLSNTRYYIKRGSLDTLTKPLYLFRKKNIYISTYGLGDKPRLIAGNINKPIELIHCKNITIEKLQIRGHFNTISGIRIAGASKQIDINKCHLDSLLWGIRVLGNGTTPVQNINIRHCKITQCADDGIFAKETHLLTIDSCIISQVNQKYKTIGTSEEQAPGDGIQLLSCNHFRLRHNHIDRSDTGNKFGIIINNTITGKILHNTIIGPMPTENGGAAIYLGYTTDSIHIAHNTLTNSPCAIYSHAKNLFIHHNILYHNQVGIWLHNNIEATILHNTLFQNPKAIIGKNLSLYNNIIAAPNISGPFIQIELPVKSNFNCYYSQNQQSIFHKFASLKGYGKISGNGSHSIFADPLLMAPELNNFSLSPHSPCIDNARIIATPEKQAPTFTGKRPDIGAWEYNSQSNR